MFRNGRIRRWLVGALALAAVGFPSAAQARFDENPVMLPSAGASAHASMVQQSGAGAQSGFEWGDAGIGAAGVVVLLGAGAAVSRVARRRWERRTVIG